MGADKAQLGPGPPGTRRRPRVCRGRPCGRARVAPSRTITASALQNADDVDGNARIALLDHDAGAAISERLHELQREGSEDNLESIRDEIADVEEQLEETRVTAPIRGRVIWTIDTVTSIGEPIAQDAAILRIADTRDPFVQTAIEEQYVPDLVLGQPVVVTVGGEDFVGFIERIGLLAVTPPEGGIPTVDLDISVEAENIEVLPGSTAFAELIVGELPDAVVSSSLSWDHPGPESRPFSTSSESWTRLMPAPATCRIPT